MSRMNAMKIQRSHCSGSRRRSRLPMIAPPIAPTEINAAATMSTSAWTRYVAELTTAVGMIATSDVAAARR